MTETQIELALREALASVSGLPNVVWPNEGEALPTVRPFVLVEFVRDDPQPAYFPARNELTGIMQLSIIVDRGSHTSSAYTYADAIVAAFPIGRVITAGSGSITIHRRPAIVGGYVEPNLNAWRLPVQARYRGFD